MDNNWAKLHRAVFLSDAFTHMGSTAQSLLIYLLMKYNSSQRNNGTLSLTLNELVRRYGWSRSPNALARAIIELRKSGLVKQTVTPKRRRCGRYTLTWLDQPAEEKK